MTITDHIHGTSEAPCPAHRWLPALVSCLLALGGCKVETSWQADELTPSTSARRLQTLPYAKWTPGEAKDTPSGVVLHDRSRACPGLNLYSSQVTSRAFLMDNDGEVLHTWAADLGGPGWHHVEPGPGGDLFVVVENRALARLDWGSDVRWRLPIRAHHDVALSPDGKIYVLTRKDTKLRDRAGELPITVDEITVVSLDGRVLEHIPLTGLFPPELTEQRRERIRDFSRRKAADPSLKADLLLFDAYHTNTVEYVDRDLSVGIRRGHLLLSMLLKDMIFVIDPEGPNLVWAWGPGALDWQHQPSILPDGNVMVFDNGAHRQSSRILEVVPSTGRVVWQYPGAGQPMFFTKFRGGAQRLPNGDTLITVSDRGRAFEITPEGRKVWEFYTTELQERDGGLERATLYRMTRFPRSRWAEFLGDRAPEHRPPAKPAAGP